MMNHTKKYSSTCDKVVVVVTFLLTTIVLCCCTTCTNGFTTPVHELSVAVSSRPQRAAAADERQQQQQRKQSNSNTYMMIDDNDKNDTDDPQNEQQIMSRRQLFMLSSSTMIVGTIMTATTTADNAYAKDDGLFKANPLTNKFLEQVRILEQDEKDAQYGGELAPGGALKADAYPKLLVPILIMNEELRQVSALLVPASSSSTLIDEANMQQAFQIVSQTKYDKIAFKKTFNAFADNIYYADTDRANLYLGGGAVPTSEQSMAYLRRNQILTTLEDLRAELEYLTKESTPVKDKADTVDLIKYSNAIVSGLEEYLNLVPPSEISKAKQLRSQS